MKYLLSLLLFVTTANANMFDGMTKEQLAEYEITIVNKKTGQVVGKMSRAEYKVVKIENEATTIPFMVRSRKSTPIILIEQKSQYKSTLILHAGIGKDGLNRSYDNGVHKVTEQDKAVGGVTLCKNQGDTGICGSAFTNSLFMLGLKLDFK